MIIVSGTQFYNYLLWVNAPLAKCLNSVLNVKVVVANGEKIKNVKKIKYRILEF